MKKKIIISLFFIISILILNISSTYAGSAISGATFGGLVQTNEEQIEQSGSSSSSQSASTGLNYNDYVPSSPSGYDNLTTTAGNVLGIVRNIGVAIAVIALTIIGFKYMLGSVEEKADYKKSMIPFVIGIILLVGGTVLVEMIYKIAVQF